VLISVVIPACNASATIGRTLGSVFSPPLPDGWRAEAIVVDDGSTDGDALARTVESFPAARIVAHGENRGMCAGRNTGIAHSAGDIVIILDADDELVLGWPDVLAGILSEWPADCGLCYAACRNQEGVVTAAEPDYQGYLTLDDLLNERHAGEYLPIFRGDYVRGKPYVDLGMRKSCGVVSYVNFALDGPFWVTNAVLRIYHDARAGSVSQGWTQPAKAAETARCYGELFARYESLYRARAPRVHRTKLLRLAVYRRLAGLPGAWAAFCSGASFYAIRETAGAGLMLVVGRRGAAWLAATVKKIGWIRRYG
jgi:glycosyltransferase involved in cell wall biosynthesis